jgi:hypothetical protein
MEKDERGHKTRRTTSTTLQLAVDHSFTGSYASRFRPLDPPSSLRCPCGHPMRSPHHLIRDCRLFYLKRIGHRLIDHSRTLSLKTLFLSRLPLALSPKTKRTRSYTSCGGTHVTSGVNTRQTPSNLTGIRTMEITAWQLDALSSRDRRGSGRRGLSRRSGRVDILDLHQGR